MESTFKLLFFLGVFLYSLITIGVFLLIIRILLLFSPEVDFMGLSITPR